MDNLLTMEEKNKLFSKDNKSFCVLPFLHLYVSSSGDVFLCCIFSNHNEFQEKLGNINDNSIEEILNGEQYKEIRRKMINGELIKGCEYCYNYEKSSDQSIRNSSNIRFNETFLNEIQCHHNGSLDKIIIKYIDIRFSNICNLKCRTCCSYSSSSWFSDSKKLGITPIQNSPIIRASKDNATFLSLLKLFNKDVCEIYFAGGEPLIMEEHYQILNRLIESENTELRIRYNTNFSTLKYKNYKILELWKKFKNVILCVSLDGMEKRGELLRSGLKWDQVIENRISLMRECPHVNFILNPTVSIMNVFHIPDFYYNWIEKGFLIPGNMHFNILQVSDFYSIQCLPKKLKEKVEKLYYQVFCIKEDRKYWYDQVIEYMNHEDKSELLPNFLHYTKRLDLIRKENFFSTFPELKEIQNDNQFEK